MDPMKINKDEARRLRHVAKAQAKDDRDTPDILSNTYVAEGFTAASDGCRIHATTTPYTLGLQCGECLIPLSKVPASGGDIEIEPAPDKLSDYPDIAAVIPTDMPLADVMLDPRFLSDAIAAAGHGPLRLVVYPGTREPYACARVELYAEAPDGEPLYALIACMAPIGTPPSWRPNIPAKPREEANDVG